MKDAKMHCGKGVSGYQAEDMERAVQSVKEGGVILYPTDTIWGLGGDATRDDVVARIFEIKNRPANKSIIVLVADDNMLFKFVRDIPPLSWEILDCSQKPTTIIYDHPIGIASSALAADGSLGIRIVNEPFCKALISKIGVPLISTSANLSEEPSASFFDEISSSVRNAVDYTVRYRQNDRTPATASVIIKLTGDGRVSIIRK